MRFVLISFVLVLSAATSSLVGQAQQKPADAVLTNASVVKLAKAGPRVQKRIGVPEIRLLII